MYLKLRKPLAFFDLETTGVNIATDRIVEISIVKLQINGEREIKTHRVNPGRKIPLETSLIHGIYDEDVKDAPKFIEIGKSIATFLDGCDLGGFNSIRFDVPMLVEEFLRNDIDFDISTRNLVDAQKIFHMMEPRSLTAALKFYCNKELIDAHSAEADTLATLEVFEAQIMRYENVVIKDDKGNEKTPIVNDMVAIHNLMMINSVDLAGRLSKNSNGVEIFNFGKHKDKTVLEVFEREPAYYDWMMNGDFPLDTKRKLTEIKLRSFINKSKS